MDETKSQKAKFLSPAVLPMGIDGQNAVDPYGITNSKTQSPLKHQMV